MKHYLFVTGCPRSGTSVLALLLGRHPKIALGVERFHNYVIPKFKLTENQFLKSRFYDFQDSDTHIRLSNQPFIKENYDLMNKRYDTSTYLGDKIPYLYKYYNELINEFNKTGTLKIIHIVRNIFDVANSYEVRNSRFKSLWRRNFKDAVDDWNKALIYTERIKKKFNDILIIDYDDIFMSYNHQALSMILSFLKLDSDEAFEQYYAEAISKSKRFLEKRQLNFILKPEQIEIIKREAQIELYKKMKHLN